MNDGGLDWEWTRAEFRKALHACANAPNDVDPWDMRDFLGELQACSLLMLNFRHRLTVEQQRALTDLARACEYFETECALDPDDSEWQEQFTRNCFDGVSTRARQSTPLFEGI